jgi:murein DD-endopeptidase MepM/ murein hydrolase activator NlpD
LTALPEPVDHFWLERPIAQAEGLTHWLDRTYPYGGTQFGTREAHLGVEFVNVRFTPVLAAAEGVVLFANSDEQTLVGPAMGYYGNVVIIEHDLIAPEGGTVYTLYGHLQDLDVEIGQRVIAGDRIGRVGDTGIAIGPHLHFEVRVGSPFDYRSTRNPDLWIQPYRQYGVIAGFVNAAAETVIQVRSESLQRETYVYGSDTVNPDPLWQENFTIGDLPTGTYEVFISDNGRRMASAFVEVRAGVTTWLDLEMK